VRHGRKATPGHFFGNRLEALNRFRQFSQHQNGRILKLARLAINKNGEILSLVRLAFETEVVAQILYMKVYFFPFTNLNQKNFFGFIEKVNLFIKMLLSQRTLCSRQIKKQGTNKHVIKTKNKHCHNGFSKEFAKPSFGYDLPLVCRKMKGRHALVVHLSVQSTKHASTQYRIALSRSCSKFLLQSKPVFSSWQDVSDGLNPNPYRAFNGPRTIIHPSRVSSGFKG